MIRKSKPKVLIIDDNYSILEYLKTLLGRFGFEIKTSSNGYEGLQDVAEFKPDIIFLDLMMPNIDGIQMLQLKKVLNEIKDIPVIVITANAGRNNVIAAMEAGADRVLAKPINVKQLKSAVDELLEGSFFETANSKSCFVFEKSENNIFKDKFLEYKSSLIEAVLNRDSNSIVKIVKVLEDYCGESHDIKNAGILFEIKDREYAKPSDWMFAQMKIKEIEQNLKEVITQF